jgi:hypothetical protein
MRDMRRETIRVRVDETSNERADQPAGYERPLSVGFPTNFPQREEKYSEEKVGRANVLNLFQTIVWFKK